jgi:hypothetical protein
MGLPTIKLFREPEVATFHCHTVGDQWFHESSKKEYGGTWHEEN